MDKPDLLPPPSCEERSKKTMERVRQSKSKAPALGDVGADHKISFTKRASSTQI